MTMIEEALKKVGLEVETEKTTEEELLLEEAQEGEILSE